MIRLLTGFIIISLSLVNLKAQNQISIGDSAKTNYSIENKSNNTNYLNGNGFSQSGDRLPQLLRDVKIYLTDAMIADVYQDTNEVIFNLDRIFDLLMEADQLGEMNIDDKDEFDRFERALSDIYTSHLTTLKTYDVSITAEKLRHDVTQLVEPIEVEIGNTKYTVLDDRDGHIPIVINKKVEQFIKYFQTKGKKQFEIYLGRHAMYGDMIQNILKQYSLPEELIYLAMIESGLNPKAYSRANASGMWQFIYSTGVHYNLNRNWYIDERRDPEKATHAACQYLTELYEQFDNWYLALAAYNAGSARITRAQRLHQTSDFWSLHALPRETRNYVPFFLAATIIGRDPAKYGFNQPKNNPWEYDVVEIEKSADLSILANSAGISLATLRQYNPELRQSATPTIAYNLKLPIGKKDLFEKKYADLPESKRFAPQYITHRVRSGENLGSISRKFRVSIHDIAAVNKIKNRHKIRVGQVLTIPVRGAAKVSYSSVSSTGPSGTKKEIYTVKKGDTLGQIADIYRVQARQIRSWNRIKYGEYIHPGQKIILWLKRS
ncbi:MAG: transglycosylase SLT domain-containing protein [Candidatus Neomarinimicrobiota bacterium]